jgi:hypothetical protein
MEFRQIINQFLYRIEAKPGWGFIATCKDSTLPPIEGATRAEVEQKIQESISASVSAQFPSLKPLLEANQVKLHYHVDRKPDGGFLVHHGDPGHEPIEGSTRDHVESVIESKLFSALMDKIPPELRQQINDKLDSGGVDITVNRATSTTTEAQGSALPEAQFSLDAFANTSQSAVTETNLVSAGGLDPSPITYEKSNSGRIFRFLFALLILAAIVYFFVHRP